MHVAFRCPVCESPAACTVDGASATLRCERCQWTRSIRNEQFSDAGPCQCLVCGCGDLWRQKDFPQKLGLAFVILAVVLSTVAWAMMQPGWAIGILMGFALLDMVLYAAMRDVLVCYRCGSRYRPAKLGDGFLRFDLEVAERYRQEARRLADSPAIRR